MDTLRGFFKSLKIIGKKIWHQHNLKIVIFILIFVFLVAYLWRNIFISIYPGHAGVLWERFRGTVTDKVYDEGLHVIFPWDWMYDYSLRIQEKHNTIKILTTAGLYVDIDISYRFYPERKSLLPLLHKEWGPKYADVFVEPESKAATIAILGNYPPEKLYSLNTIAIQTEIKAMLDKQFRNSKIILQDFLITRLALPKAISDAIERKLTQEQLLQEYNYRLAIEEKEKSRKEIESMGIKLFQQISGISILKWRGIEATSEIARSNNAKVIVIGTGPQGLPVILNAEK